MEQAQSILPRMQLTLAVKYYLSTTYSIIFVLHLSLEIMCMHFILPSHHISSQGKHSKIIVFESCIYRGGEVTDLDLVLK